MKKLTVVQVAVLEQTQATREVVKIVQGAQEAQEVAQVQHPKTQVTGIQVGFNQPEPQISCSLPYNFKYIKKSQVALI